VARGNFIDLFPDWHGERFALFAFHPWRKHQPAKVRAFVDFCVEITLTRVRGRTSMHDHRNSQDVVSFGPFSLFAGERLLKKADEPIPLGGRVLDVLIALAERAGKVIPHKELLSSVWPDVTVGDANLRAHIAALCEGGERDQARDMLAPVYERFTEEFETADLKSPRTLLEDLR
jgi:hypothetical protein